MASKSAAEMAAATRSPGELAQARDICARSAATLTAVLVELRGVEILGAGSFGPKILSRVELAAERLGWAAAFLERELAKAPARTSP